MPAPPDWLEDLYREYQPRLFGLCYRLTGDTNRAEDLESEVVLKLVRKIHLYDRSRPFWPWLRTVACNAWATGLHQQDAYTLSLDEEIEAGRTDGAVDSECLPLNTLVRREEIERMRAAIAGLPDLFRAVTVLFYCEGMDCAAIAEALGRKVGTVHRQLHAARHRLAAAFPEYTPASR